MTIDSLRDSLDAARDAYLAKVDELDKKLNTDIEAAQAAATQANDAKKIEAIKKQRSLFEKTGTLEGPVKTDYKKQKDIEIETLHRAFRKAHDALAEAGNGRMPRPSRMSTTA